MWLEASLAGWVKHQNDETSPRQTGRQVGSKGYAGLIKARRDG